MADIMLPFLQKFKMIKKFLLKIHMDSASKVSQIKTPIMFITGSCDNFVPTSMTELLHRQCLSKCKVLHVVPGGDHNDTVQRAGDDYKKFYLDFFKNAERNQPTFKFRQ